MNLNVVSSLLKQVTSSGSTSNIVKTAAKGAVSVPIPLSSASKALTADTATFSLKSLKSKLSKVVSGYHERKLEAARKFGSSERILNNWQESFGVADKDGVFRNAINHLVESGKIDEYILKRCPQLTSSKDIEKVRGVLVKYLEKNLDIYSYERIQKILQGFNGEISAKLKNGAVLYVHDDKKSYGIISEIYKTINPDAKVVTGWKNLQNYAKTHKGFDVVMLDDCLVSGKSASDVYKSITTDLGYSSVKNVDLYLLSAFKDGVASLPKGLNVKYAGELKQNLKNSDFFKKELSSQDKGLMLGFLGRGSTAYNAYSAMMFEYMAPNNNGLFAANMIKELFSGPECAIKGIFTQVTPDAKTVNGLSKMVENLKLAG